MASNNFFFNSDPLLGGNNYEAQMNELERMKQSIMQKQEALKQVREQVVQQPQAQQSKTPVWDEIESIMSAMSDKEFDLVTSDDEFLESQKVITDILQSQYMAIMRPIVENSQEGKDALDRHLTLVKRLRKVASSEVDKEINDFADYKANYSDIPYSEYQKMKNSKKSKK